MTIISDLCMQTNGDMSVDRIDGVGVAYAKLSAIAVTLGTVFGLDAFNKCLMARYFER